MPNFNNYSQAGRSLAVIFTCRRCQQETVHRMDKHAGELDNSYGRLDHIKPPSGWADLSYGLLLCPECYARYQKFMTMQEE